MKTNGGASIVCHFSILRDPRIEQNKRHNLIDIMVLTVCAVVTGAGTWEEIEEYGKERIGWLRRFIALENGVPSQDTISRLFIGCIVTIDAAGCQTTIVEKIKKDRKADYVLAVKGNQPHLEEQITEFFADMDEEDLAGAEWVESHKTVDKGHRRIEVREYFHSDEIAPLPRRSHWSIENSLHWALEMSFREDESRMRSGTSAENFAMMRRMALSLVKHDTQSKKSLKRRRRVCLLTERYPERILFNNDDLVRE